ncbi:MAG TPA: hypothetical protein PK133_12095 [Ferruginibacter sp.]|nr:hypothetical protein [Ferruginibacter sp.]
MSKNTKIFLPLMIVAFLFVSLVVTSCNNSGDKKDEAPKDSVSTEKQMEAAPAVPAVPDTTKRDTAATRPTPGGA